jgi:catalase
LFYNSQSAVEQAHIAAAFRFELSKVTVPAVRERVVSMLRNASEDLAAKVADGLNMRPLPAAMPKALDVEVTPEVARSPALSLLARPGDGSVAGRKVAVLVADGVAGQGVLDLQARALDAGVVARIVAPRIGEVQTSDGCSLQADASLENEPGFLFDALVLADGAGAVMELAADGHTLETVRDQYRHGKTIVALGSGADLLDMAGISVLLPAGDPDPGITLATDAAAGAQALLDGLKRHRHPERETDPPAV